LSNFLNDSREIAAHNSAIISRIDFSFEKFPIYGILRRCNNFDEDLTRTRLLHISDSESNPILCHNGSSLLDENHCLLA